MKAGRIGYGWFSGMSMVTGSKLRGEAWEFCKFCGSEPGQKLLMELGQVLPPTPRMATSDPFLKSSPPASNKTYLEVIATTRLHPSAWIIDTPAYNAILNPVLNEVWSGAKAARGALPPLVPQLNAILAQG